MDELYQKFLKFMQMGDAELQAFAQRVEQQKGPADPALIPSLAQEAGLPPEAIQYDPNWQPPVNAGTQYGNQGQFVDMPPGGPGGFTNFADRPDARQLGAAEQFAGMGRPGGQPSAAPVRDFHPAAQNMLGSSGHFQSQGGTGQLAPIHMGQPQGMLPGAETALMPGEWGGFPGGMPGPQPAPGDPAQGAMWEFTMQAMADQAAAQQAREEAEKDRNARRATPMSVGNASSQYTPMATPTHALAALAQSRGR